MLILFRLFNYTIIFSVLISLFRIHKIEKCYYPFIIFLCYGFLNECISDFSAYLYHSNAANSNLYVLFSSLLVLYQLYVWSIKKPGKLITALSLSILILSWVVENFYFSTIWQFNTINNIMHYLFIILFSIFVVAQYLSFGIPVRSVKVVFLLSCTFLIQYTVSVIVEIFWIYGANSSDYFLTNVYKLISYMSLVANLIYIIAILWIPKKRELRWL